MKKIFLTALVFLVGIGVTLAWGVWGHQHINRAAVLALPPEMRSFFYNHIDFVTEEAVVPDLRKYTIGDKAEGPRHFINMEVFDSASDVSHLARTMKDARGKYPDSVFNKAGILPWYIQEVEEKLTAAFRSGKKTEILFLAADLGHYIGDAHMPLHTALNHDGLQTGQKGIHAFWEGQLVEMFGEGYNLYTGGARYIDDITKETWLMIDSTHHLASKVLSLDKQLAGSLPKGKVYVLDSAGKPLGNMYRDPVHTREYAMLYHEKLQGMIESQLKASIAETASYWYTAWVNAGKPDLSGLDPSDLTMRNRANMDRDERLWRSSGKVDMVNSGGEFGKWAR